MESNSPKKKVMLGMSGGVDSSVSAHILLEQGYEVIGVTMQIWPDSDREDGCCSLRATDDARRVANKLGIPYYVLNMKEEFQKYVIDYFIKEYEAGRTPNPCIACNRYVKFGSLLDKAKSMDIDYIATGHYAIIEQKDNRYLLKKSIDDSKDQSYVLYNLTQEQLSKTLFPLGEYRKTNVREIAEDIGLSVAKKPDSQEICFIEDNNYGKFIKEHSNKEIEKGNILDTTGKWLGFHNGITNYTIGQRHGLGIALGKPMFVVDIDTEKNQVILGSNWDTFKKEFTARDMNYISIDGIEKEIRIKAKIRYKAPEADATVYSLKDGSVKIVFDVPQRAVTPGQAVVFYDNDIVVGGGTIC